MKFTFSKTWKDTFGDAIEAVKDKIGDNRYPFTYGSSQESQDYQFSKLPTKDMNYVKMLKAIADNPTKIRVWKDVVKRTNPDKANMKGWGNTTCAYLGIAGMIEKDKTNGYTLTPLGKAVVDYCFSKKTNESAPLTEDADWNQSNLRGMHSVSIQLMAEGSTEDEWVKNTVKALDLPVNGVLYICGEEINKGQDYLFEAYSPDKNKIDEIVRKLKEDGAEDIEVDGEYA